MRAEHIDLGDLRTFGGTECRAIRRRDGRIGVVSSTGMPLGVVVSERDAELLDAARSDLEREGNGGALVGMATTVLVGLLLIFGLVYGAYHAGRAWERAALADPPTATPLANAL